MGSRIYVLIERLFPQDCRTVYHVIHTDSLMQATPSTNVLFIDLIRVAGVLGYMLDYTKRLTLM